MSYTALSQLASLAVSSAGNVELAASSSSFQSSARENFPTSGSGKSSVASTQIKEWTKNVNADERKNIRLKIKAAYQKKAPTYEALLEICSSIEEEFLFSEAPSRLDYIKSGVQFERRVANKICCLRCCANTPKPTTTTSNPCIAGTKSCTGPNGTTAACSSSSEVAPVLAMMCQLTQCMSSGESDSARPAVEMDDEELSRIKRAKRQL